MALPVRTKRDFIRRFRKGEFGNRGLVWDTLKEFKESGYKGLVHLRNRVAGGDTYYNVPADRVEWWWNKLENGSYYLAAMAPHNKNLIQGEVCLSERGLELSYSTEKGMPMRDALASKRHNVAGIISSLTLKAYLCPNSYDWMQYLLSEYEGHVIEFSTFDCYWGTIPFHNTTIWECRLY